MPGESHGQRSLTGYSPWAYKESDRTEQLNDSNKEGLKAHPPVPGEVFSHHIAHTRTEYNRGKLYPPGIQKTCWTGILKRIYKGATYRGEAALREPVGNIEAPRTRDSGNHHHPRLERQGLKTALPEPGGSWSLEEGSLMGTVVTNGRASRVQVTSRRGKKCPKLTFLPPSALRG